MIALISGFITILSILRFATPMEGATISSIVSLSIAVGSVSFV